MDNFTYTDVFLQVVPVALVLLMLAGLTSSVAQPCEKEVDEFKGTTTIVCPELSATIEEEPQEPVITFNISLVERNRRNMLVLTAISDSWNFLSVEKAYIIAGGENFAGEFLQAHSSVEDGHVIEQHAMVLREEQLRQLARAESFRMKAGQLVLRARGHQTHAAYLLEQ